MTPLSRSHRVALAGVVAAWTGAAACGGNVVVDDASQSAGGATSTTGTTGTGNVSTGGATSTGSSTDTSTIIQVPDGGSPQCSQDYFELVNTLETALGCTPWAGGGQCTGVAVLHDPCGCAHVGNESHPDAVSFAQSAWMGCVADGCCGAQAGCLPCPPPPTTGHCDMFTSRCVPGP